MPKDLEQDNLTSKSETLVSSAVKVLDHKTERLLGYCTTCKRPRRVQSISTQKMPNESFVHAGRCQVCKTVVFKKVKPWEFREIKKNLRVPERIYDGPKTSGRILAILQKREVAYGESGI